MRAGESANIFLAPAPRFFPQAAKAPAPHFFSQAASAPRDQKHPAPCGSGSCLFVKFGEIFFSPQTTNVKLQEI